MTEVVVYTMDRCVKCSMLKKHLDKLGINYKETSVVDASGKIYFPLGHRDLPVLQVGEESVAGFNPEAIHRLLSKGELI